MSKNSVVNCLKFCPKAIILILLLCNTGCCIKNRQDPLEGLNRGIYGVNKALDTVIIKPTARAYEAIIPRVIRIAVSNFFQNLSELPNIANDLLQGEFCLARHDAARFVINTTWGIGGLLDAAAMAGLERHKQDFGLTLASWGYKESMYFVIPVFGPSTIRDTIGSAANFWMSIPPYLRNVKVRNGLFILNAVDKRVVLLKTEPAIQEAVDEYVFVRDAYLQYRQHLISDAEMEECIDGQNVPAPKLEGPPE